MYTSYQVIGLQRSGTNWVNQLIKANFKVKEKRSFWKHLTTLGVKGHRKERYSKYGLRLEPENSTYFIVLSKDFVTWSESIERNSEDFFNSHDFRTEEPLKEVYDAWFKWINLQSDKDNFYHIDYLDWLENWEQKLSEIQSITGWKKRGLSRKFVNVKKVPRSPKFEVQNYKEVTSEESGSKINVFIKKFLNVFK